MAQDPPADVLVARVAQNTVGQDDAHATARLEPVHAALDEEHLGGDAALEPPGVAIRAVIVALVGVRQVVVLEDVGVIDGDGRAKGRVGHHHINAAQARLFIGLRFF